MMFLSTFVISVGSEKIETNIWIHIHATAFLTLDLHEAVTLLLCLRC